MAEPADLQPPPEGLELLTSLTIPASPASELEFSPDGRYVGASAWDTVFIWTVDGGEPLHRITIPPTSRSSSTTQRLRPLGTDKYKLNEEKPSASFGWMPDGRRIMFEGVGQVGVLQLDAGEVDWRPTITIPEDFSAF